MKFDLIVTREKAKYRNDIKFRAGVELLEMAEKALSEGQFADYFVWYCSDDPDVVYSITFIK